MSKNKEKQSLLNKIMAKKWYLVVMILMVVGAFYFLNRNGEEEYRTTAVSKQSITESINASGEVIAKDSAELRFNTPSKVVWVGVKKGDRVKKWQAVASLDKRTLENNLKKKLLDYQTTRWDFEQNQDDYDVNGRALEQVILTDEEKRILEKSQFGLDKSVLDVEISELAAKEAVLISPIEGTVISDGGFVAGENLTPASLSTDYIKVANLSTLQFKVQVDEVDFGKITMGQSVKVVLDAFPDDVFSGKVVFINKEGTKTLSGGVTVPIEVAFDEVDERLVLGLSGEADFIIEEKQNALVVPREFIKSDNDNQVVYVLVDGKPEKVTVTTGLMTMSQTEISSGLKEGQEIILVKNGNNND